jgi:hypothetical protein
MTSEERRRLDIDKSIAAVIGLVGFIVYRRVKRKPALSKD